MKQVLNILLKCTKLTNACTLGLCSLNSLAAWHILQNHESGGRSLFYSKVIYYRILNKRWQMVRRTQNHHSYFDPKPLGSQHVG